MDADDYSLLSRFTWTRTPAGYAVTQSDVFGGKIVLMHRMIVAARKGEHVDHRDGNGLNNRKSNLRRCTVDQNVLNRRKSGDKKSPFKGVHQRRGSTLWFAVITFKNKAKYLGSFETEQLAAMAYDDAAAKLFGEFACFNFPDKVGTFKKPTYRCPHGIRCSIRRRAVTTCRKCYDEYHEWYELTVRKRKRQA